jgi:hypothetical protein
MYDSINPVPYFIKLDSNGNYQSTFTTNLGAFPSDEVHSFDIDTSLAQPKIYVGGFFNAGFARFDPNGIKDAGYSANVGVGTSNKVFSIALQADGKLLIGGNFADIFGITVEALGRANSDGTPDTTFLSQLGVGFAGAVKAIKVQSDGKIIVGGNFTGYQGNPVNYLTRITVSGVAD